MIIGFDYVVAAAEAPVVGHRRHADQLRVGQDTEPRPSQWRSRLMAALRAIAFASAAQYSLPFVPEPRDYPVSRP
ncbi:hypothetical protein EV643_110211 [Kribbella sp. VKM Ac-2527]|uniref:Uncharacterized protein n=1 Tax=Kribbella caucasensis TaxID=2512215 RepID=A0A4R6KBK8_9ACTN|nr:hypothetical protein [Kribbella sp. VKM Ac-2527]TDO46828.1 hypothetical protein EV643_110211 [Kribbella sp. VKM Ac-2527]